MDDIQHDITGYIRERPTLNKSAERTSRYPCWYFKMASYIYIIYNIYFVVVPFECTRNTCHKRQYILNVDAKHTRAFMYI